MSDYLSTYGVGEARRERVIKWIVLSVLGLAISYGLLYYFVIRDFGEKRRISQFMDRLRAKDYPGAYALWCPDAKACPEYPLDKFLEDWGPKSSHADVSNVDLSRKRSCEALFIQTLKFPNEEVHLSVDRKTRLIGFSPFPICNPRYAAPGP